MQENLGPQRPDFWLMALRAHPFGVDQQKSDKVARFTLALSGASLTQLLAFLGQRGPLIELSIPVHSSVPIFSS